MLEFTLLHYLLIVAIWVGIFNLCYYLLGYKKKRGESSKSERKPKKEKRKPDDEDDFYSYLDGGERY